jgi:hypothetical protein
MTGDRLLAVSAGSGAALRWKLEDRHLPLARNANDEPPQGLSMI